MSEPPLTTSQDSQSQGSSPNSATKARIRSASKMHGEHSSAFSSSMASNSFCSMLEFGVSSEQGPRKTMEDQHKAMLSDDPVTPRGDDQGKKYPGGIPFFGVYDGHGGTQCAEFLRQNLHHFVLGHPKIRSDPETAIKESIIKAEQAFMDKCRAEKIESGSTIAIALIVDDKLVTANVGDSEIVLSRGGAPELLTTKHHLSCNESELERVRACGGRIFHSRVGHPKFNPQLVSLAVTRAIGDAGFKLEEYTDGKNSGIIPDADTKVTPLTAADKFLIIGCDGLWDVVKYDEAVSFCTRLFAAGATPSEVSDAIVQEALRRGSNDNVTVLVVHLQRDKHACA